jgi:hypothetical protein
MFRFYLKTKGVFPLPAKNCGPQECEIEGMHACMHGAVLWCKFMKITRDTMSCTQASTATVFVISQGVAPPPSHTHTHIFAKKTLSKAILY